MKSCGVEMKDEWADLMLTKAGESGRQKIRTRTGFLALDGLGKRGNDADKTMTVLMRLDRDLPCLALRRFRRQTLTLRDHEMKRIPDPDRNMKDA